jgi:hypothetical protein
MRPRLFPLLLAAALGLAGSACKDKTTNAAKKADEIRKFRERQKNLARKCYQDITTKYPDSEFTAQAAERLQQLGPPTTPKK